MKPRTAADVVLEHIGDDVEVAGISGTGSGHRWYERVAEGTATVTFASGGELCFGVGRLHDGVESAEVTCVPPIEGLEAPQRVEVELGSVELWQVPDDAASVTVIGPEVQYETRPERLGGGAWVIRPWGTAIDDVVVDSD